METRECLRCKETKPVVEFSVKPRRLTCRPCWREGKRIYMKIFRDEHPGYNRRRGRMDRLRTRGLTLEDFEKMFIAQEGRCKICQGDLVREGVYNKKGEDRSRLACVDHNHRTGGIRAILCNRCNRALGMFGDDTEVLQKAAAYLKEFADG